MQQYFTEQGENYEEAYRKVREKYGEGATILFRKTVMIRGGFLGLFPREGVEVSGPIPQVRSDTVSSYQAAIGAYSGSGIPDIIRRPKDPSYPKDTTYLKDTTYTKDTALNKDLLSPKEPLEFEKEKMKVLAAAGQKDPSLQMILSEVRTIKEKIDEQKMASTYEEHAALSRIDELLILNDFPPSYRQGIGERLKKEFSLENLDDFDMVQYKVLEWIGKSILVYNEGKQQRYPRIMILVGPTGVGKTTTIAKLAANFVIDNNGKKIREIILITIDTFRIGARQQLEAYGKILQSPCFAVEDYEELKKTIAVNSDKADVILIDTMGKSPRDLIKLGEMKALLDACGSQVEVHLAISAATKSSDVQEILQQFEPFNYRSVVITKLDETTRVGNIVGVLAEKQKPISYITNGQKVPLDIQKASIITFLTSLEGFKINRTKLEENFPNTNSKQPR